jgi:hypothetical protein
MTNATALLLIQQLAGSQQGSKDAAAVDVAHQQTPRIGQLRHAHIHDVALFQIDLGRRTGALEHDDIVLRGQDAITLFHDRQQLGHANFLIVARIELAPHLPAHHNLRRGVAAGLDENRVHMHGRRNSAGFGLQRLRASNLVAVGRGRRIQRHILRLERRHAITCSRKDAAQGGRHQRLSYMGARAQHHDGPGRHRSPAFISSRARASV